MCHSLTGMTKHKVPALAKHIFPMRMSATGTFIYKGVYQGWLFLPLVLHILMHSWSCPLADSVRNRQSRIACSSECSVFGFYEWWQHMWWSNETKWFRPPCRPKGQLRQSHMDIWLVWLMCSWTFLYQHLDFRLTYIWILPVKSIYFFLVTFWCTV